jgi:hypothetical protein
MSPESVLPEVIYACMGASASIKARDMVHRHVSQVLRRCDEDADLAIWSIVA